MQGSGPDHDRLDETDHSEITRLLNAHDDGRDEALEQVAIQLMDELRRIAGAHCRGERADHTLQPTAVVNEAWIRLARQEGVTWQSREHFLSVASLAMRRILIDHARKRKSIVRGGDRQRVPLGEAASNPDQGQQFDLEDLSQALDELDTLDPELARIVDLRCLAGLAIDDVAELTDLSAPQVKRRWALARGWLQNRLKDSM
ncbi:MAG: ECF-type sigma factor [Phycisphaerales bacterium]|nr:ECF-type sigma factor [Phycisphaerales bacterium]